MGLAGACAGAAGSGATKSGSSRATTTGRFHVPEVVLEDKLSALQMKWFPERNDAERTVLRLADTAGGNVRFQVEHRTMKMSVLQGSDVVIELNTDGLLRYEPARTTTFARSETFRSHVDTPQTPQCQSQKLQRHLLTWNTFLIKLC